MPLVGRIAAGAPILAEEHVEEYVAVPLGFASDAEHFALTVQGDSMILAGIFDRDLVVIRRQPDARDGELVAALIDGEEATIKRLRRSPGRVTLLPENDKGDSR